MNEDCRRSFLDVVLRRAPETLPALRASADETAYLFKWLLGIGWTRQFVRCASAHTMSQMIKRVLANQSTRPHAKQLRLGLHAAWFPVDGVFSAEESRWRALIQGGRDKNPPVG